MNHDVVGKCGNTEWYCGSGVLGSEPIATLRCWLPLVQFSSIQVFGETQVPFRWDCKLGFVFAQKNALGTWVMTWKIMSLNDFEKIEGAPKRTGNFLSFLI